MVLMGGCTKENNENEGNNESGGSGGNGWVTPESPTIVSIEEAVNSDGDVVLEVGYEDQSRMYFILLDPETAAVTNHESFYGEGNNGYVYRGDVAIPSEITHLGETYTITVIGKKCFANAKLLKSVYIPNTVISIEDEAFSQSGIKEIIIPNSIESESIGIKVFKDCHGLKTVDLPNSWKRIPNQTFSGCNSLSAMTFPDSLERIEIWAFSNCDGLSAICFPERLERIDDLAFSDCDGLSAIYLPVKLKSIGDGAFDNCSRLAEIYYNARKCRCYGKYTWGGCSALETIVIGDLVDTIPRHAFQDLPTVTNVVFSESLKFIGGSAFFGCSSLKSVIIPNSVRSIEGWFVNEEGYPSYRGAFQRCTSLSSVIIGNSVRFIGQNAFKGCSKLDTVICQATTPPDVGLMDSDYQNSFLSSPNVIYVPSQSVDAYCRKAYWSVYSDIIEGF